MNQSTHLPSNVLAFERAAPSRYRILLVEDEMLIAFGLTDMVEALGASWVAASRVGSALAVIATERFDAAIVDMKLAGESADPVMDALSARNIPFIITTGYGPGGVAEKYRSVTRFTKPYMHDHVEAALLNVLASCRTPSGRHRAPS